MSYTRIAALAVALGVSSAASAVPVTVLGPGFSLQYDSSLVGLYGTPLLTGNQLSWVPSGSPGFTAQSFGGFGLANSTFALRVFAQPGFELTGLSLSEAGTYFHFGSGALVSATGQLTATPLPGSAQSAPLTVVSAFTPNALFDFGLRNWSAAAGPVALPAGTTGANVSVQSLLASFVPPGGLGAALIEMNSAVLTINTIAAIPEPETYAMLLSGLVMVGLLALRRRPRD